MTNPHPRAEVFWQIPTAWTDKMTNPRPIPGGGGMGTLGWLSHYYSIFPLTLTFTLLASPCWLLAFSYFLTADIKFSCCFPNEIRLLCFLSLALALIHVSVDKNLAEKIFDFVVYFTLKVGVARVFALKTSSYNRVAIPADWVILQWVRNFCFLRSGPEFFKQWNNHEGLNGVGGGGGPLVGCRLKFSYFVGSRLKFSIFVSCRLI